jgi:membrane associated rhomboid family serine protease
MSSILPVDPKPPEIVDARLRFLRRLPFTTAMLAGLVSMGILYRSFVDPTSRAIRHTFGSSVQTMLEGDVFRLFSSLFLTSGRWHFWVSVLMLAICVGWAEWSHGTLRTIFAFLAAHIITLLAISVGLVLLTGSGQFAFAEILIDARDVGPSAGYYGCLGLATGSLKSGWRWVLLAMILFSLLARMIYSAGGITDHPHLVIGDVAHMIAYPVGLLLAKIGKNRSR